MWLRDPSFFFFTGGHVTFDSSLKTSLDQTTMIRLAQFSRPVRRPARRPGGQASFNQPPTSNRNGSSFKRQKSCSCSARYSDLSVLMHSYSLAFAKRYVSRKGNRDLFAYSSLCYKHHTATGTHVPYGITQCYLPPGRGDIPAFTPIGLLLRPVFVNFSLTSGDKDKK